MFHSIWFLIAIGIGILGIVFGLCQLNPETKKHSKIILISLVSILIIILKIFSKNNQPPISQPKPQPVPLPDPQQQSNITIPTPTSIVIINDYQLSSHFTYGMMVITEHRNYIDENFNEGQQYIENLRKLCINVLEPIIELVGIVPTINSSFRCPVLNTSIGASINSQHMKAEAADTTYGSLTIPQAFNKIAWSKIPYSQIIFEFNSWVHIGLIDITLYPGKIGEKWTTEKVNGETKYVTVTKPL